MAVEGIFRELNHQWSGNRRLRLGCAAICAIALLYGAMAVRDRQSLVRQECRQHAAQLDKLQRISGQSFWSDRSKKTRDALVQAQLRLFQAESPGLAQAKIQTWFDQHIAARGLKKVRLTVDRAVPARNRPGLLQVSTTVTGVFEPQRMVRFLKDIETTEHVMVIRELDVIWKGKRGRFTLICTSWFKAPVTTS